MAISERQKKTRKRNLAIYEAFIKGQTRAELGRKYNLQPQRIGQIVRVIERVKSMNYEYSAYYLKG